MSKRKTCREELTDGKRRETGRKREAARQREAARRNPERNQEAIRRKAVQRQEEEQDQEAVKGKQETRQDRKKELERLILEYTEELAEDINLRLLAQQDIEAAGCRRGRYHTGNVLYVESIIVTDVRYPEERKRGSSIAELGKKVKKIWKQGRVTDNCSGMEEWCEKSH